MEYDYMDCAAKRVAEEGLPTGDGGVGLVDDDEPRCTCLRRDQRYMDDPYSEPPILRRDPECEVHGIDPDRARDERIDRELCE